MTETGNLIVSTEHAKKSENRDRLTTKIHFILIEKRIYQDWRENLLSL